LVIPQPVDSKASVQGSPIGSWLPDGAEKKRGRYIGGEQFAVTSLRLRPASRSRPALRR